MKLFFKYIYQYRYTIIIFILFVFIFAGIFSLYSLEAEAVFYAASICMLILAVVICIRFINFRRRHKEREQLFNNILIMTEELPKPETIAEADYCRMIEKLRLNYQKNTTLYQQEKTECTDYYTAWIHQIKTPISVMRMILQSEDTDEHRELSAELFRIEQYAEMALCYLRLDSSSSDFVFKQYSLDKIIRNAVRKYASQFVRKKIRLQYDGTDITVLTDEKWLSFIIEQLLSNAVKYTENGCVSITVTDRKILKISDTGIGISAEDLPRIFEKGFTGYNGRAYKKSTGLGLYLCKKAADKLSHKITAQSLPGKGSAFCVDLNSNSIDIE